MSPDTRPLQLLYQALESPIGIVVEVSDVKLAMGRLYTARRTDPSLEVLQIRTSCVDPDGELWITRSKPKEKA